MLEHVIFSVDNATNLNLYMKAIHKLDVLRATRMKGGVTMCIGSYKGELEPSFMVLARDWDEVVRDGMSQWMENQESILRVPGDTRQPCALTTVQGEHIETLDEMSEYKPHNLTSLLGWTYVMATNKYYSC